MLLPIISSQIQGFLALLILGIDVRTLVQEYLHHIFPAIVVDDGGNAYITGHTESAGFPKYNAIYPTYQGALAGMPS